MSNTTHSELHHAAHDDHHHDESEKVIFGFWIYIMSDCLLFATLFAVYAVLSNGFYAGGVDPKSLIDLNFVLGETALLLFSSFTFGMAMLYAYQKNEFAMKAWLIVTFLLGAGFLAMELYEFYHFSHEGATPFSNGYWSAFYALVGTHGMHVFWGMIWMVAMFVHFARDGITESNLIRLSCLSLFWHFLDIIWICVFSFVYLFGVYS